MTLQGRMSAMNLDSPWRGPLVDATVVGFDQGNRQASAFFYSDILASAAVVVADPLDIFFVDASLASPHMSASALASPRFKNAHLASPSFTGSDFT